MDFDSFLSDLYYKSSEDTPEDIVQYKQTITSIGNRIEKLAETTLDTKIILEPVPLSSEDKDIWKCIKDGDAFKLSVVVKDIINKPERWSIADALNAIAYGKYVDEAEFVSVPFPIDATPEYHQLINMINTIRIESQLMQYYPGTKDNFSYKWLKQNAQISAKEEAKLTKPVQFIYALYTGFWGGEMPTIDEKVLDALENLEESLFEAYNTESIRDMLSVLNKNIWPVFKKLVDEHEQEQGKKGTKDEYQQLFNNNTSLSELMSKMAENSGEKDSENETKEAEKPKDEKSNFGMDVETHFDKIEASNIDKNNSQSNGTSVQYGQDDPVLGTNCCFHDEPKLAKEDYLTYETMYNEIRPLIPFFKKKLSSIMKDNNYNRLGGSHRSGKLDNKKLYKVGVNNPRIFNKKIMRQHKDYVVSLVVDESGSMSSSQKNRHAAKATILFAEVLNAVGIPFEIRGFNATLRQYKKIAEKFTHKHRRQLERIILESHGYDAGCNNDGFALWSSSHTLRHYGTRNTERIIIMVSDGLPAPNCNNIPINYKSLVPKGKITYRDFDLKHEIVEASKDAVVIGVGVNAHHVSDFYPQNVVVEDVKWLPVQLLNKLRKNIKRG